MGLKYASGNTPLTKNKELCERFKVNNLFIKDESKNPFGTFKDRRSELIIKKAIEEQVDKLVLITSGNAGYSLLKFSEGSDIKVFCVVDKKLKESIKDKLNGHNKIIEIDLSSKILKPEEVISLARESDEEVIWDVTNGFHEAYEKIIQEIRHIEPDLIILPMGSGEAFVGCFNGIKKYKLKAKLIGVTVKDKWNSFADKLHTPWTPYKSKIQSILKEGHRIIILEENLIKNAYKENNKVLDIEPSSAVVFGALPKIKFKKEDKIVLINSGKGIV